MSKKQKDAQLITVNDIDYDIDQFTSEQITLVNHISDLDRKINSSQFNLEQLLFGKDAFVNALASSLEEPAVVD